MSSDPAITTEPAPQRATRVRWLVFVLACAVSWLLYLHRYAWGAIQPALRTEYPELTYTDLGWLNLLFQVTYAIGQVPGGLAGDRWGPRAVLTISLLIWSGTVAGLAWVTGLGQFPGIRLAFGAAQAAAYPNLNKVTRSWFPLSIRTTVQGLVASLAGRAGGACAPLIVATILMAGLGLGWRGAILTISGLGFWLALAIWLLFRNRPGEHPWVNEAERNEIETGAEVTAITQRPGLVLSPGNLCTLAALLVYAAASTFVDQFFVNSVPLFLKEGRGLTEGQTGLYASLPLWGGAFGGAFGGVLNDWLIRRTGNRRWSRSGVAFTGKLLAAILLALAVTLDDGRGAALMLLACKFFGDWSLATVWGTITDIGGRASGTVFGIVNMAGAIAGIAANWLIGHMLDEYSWERTLQVLAVVFFVSAVAWLFVDSNRRLLAEEHD